MKRLIPSLILILVTLVLDQVAKWWIVGTIPVGEYVFPIPALSDVFALTQLHNTGVSFGLFQGANLLFAITSAIIGVIIAAYLWRLPRGHGLLRLALTLLLAGTIGNLIDRVRLGYVIDFVAVGSFARFNVADSVVFVGAVLLGLTWLLDRPEQPIHEGTSAKTS